MNSNVTSKNVFTQKVIKIILWTAFLAGTLDILSAIINTYLQFNISPGRVFRFIASGVFGDEAYSGGAEMIAAGVLFHYSIALIWTAIFFFIFMKVKLPSGYKYIFGLLYGILVWLVMNLIVIPLSNTPQHPLTFRGVLLGVLFLMFFIGLPVSLSYHKYYSGIKSQALNKGIS